ncbi:hypothetical protein PIB30_015309 [Stylosanthes scabra]|uniref:Uncharacterized protein n=1 Tax=Stylosanthes scabra TaxID=79078 RepID=A0ABU6Z5D7_9FABA|nr:hypothetical protein [Stylosanthes scabra]
MRPGLHAEEKSESARWFGKYVSNLFQGCRRGGRQEVIAVNRRRSQAQLSEFYQEIQDPLYFGESGSKCAIFGFG